MVLRVSASVEGNRARATVQGTIEGEAFWEANAPLATDATWLLPTASLLAARLGVPLEVGGPVDTAAVGGAQSALALMSTWYPQLRPAGIVAASVTEGGESGAGAACFFSGGVDSWYSVLSHREEVAALIFVHGFDIPVGDSDLGQRALDSARASSAALGLPLIEVRTDIRGLADRHLRWDYEYHGAALATVAHLVGERFDTMLIPGSTTPQTAPRAMTSPWGSSIALDYRWSSSRLRIVHDEPVSRAVKVATIARSRAAMEHLRVCWENPDGAFNCGECEKCLRTRTNLRAAGAEGRCATLPARLDVRELKHVPVTTSGGRYARENLELARERGDDELVKAMHTFIRRHQVHQVRSMARDVAKRALTAVGLRDAAKRTLTAVGLRDQP